MSGEKLKSGDCRYCLGTGQVLLVRSMFLGDGYRRERCGICSGSGRSAYLPEGGWIRWQRQAHLRDAAMRNAPKGLDYIALGRLAMEVSA